MMTKARVGLMLALIALISVGCASPYTVGICTGIHSNHVKGNMEDRDAEYKKQRRMAAARAVVTSQADEQTKEKALQLVALGADDREVKMMVGFDAMSLLDEPEEPKVVMTKGEKVAHVFWTVCDVIINGVLIDQGARLLSSDDDDGGGGGAQNNFFGDVHAPVSATATDASGGSQSSGNSNGDNNGTGTSNQDINE